MTGERNEIARGHLDECLEHLGRTLASQFPARSKDIGRARIPIAKFCGVTTDSVKRWLTEGGIPEGINNLKLICYLDMLGYSVIELENHPADVRAFIELLGYGVMAPADAARLVGFGRTDRLFEVLNGRQTLTERKRQSMWDLWQERKEILEKKKQAARKLYVAKTTTKVDKPTVGALRLKAPVGPLVTRPAVFSVMEALLNLLDNEDSQELLERILVKQTSEATIVLILSSRLSVISSHLIAEQAQMQVVDDDA